MVKCKVKSIYFLRQCKECIDIIVTSIRLHAVGVQKIKGPVLVRDASKSHWSILTWLLNNKKIPSVFTIFHNRIVISNFEEKANLFNSCFASPFTPACLCVTWQQLSHKNSSKLIGYYERYFFIIKSLDPNKSYSWDVSKDNVVLWLIINIFFKTYICDCFK